LDSLITELLAELQQLVDQKPGAPHSTVTSMGNIEDEPMLAAWRRCRLTLVGIPVSGLRSAGVAIFRRDSISIQQCCDFNRPVAS
jgi:hypothetical protein